MLLLPPILTLQLSCKVGDSKKEQFIQGNLMNVMNTQTYELASLHRLSRLYLRTTTNFFKN